SGGLRRRFHLRRRPAGGGVAPLLPGGGGGGAVHRRGGESDAGHRRKQRRRGPPAPGAGHDGPLLAGRGLRLPGGEGMRSAFEGLLSRYGQSVTLTCAATGESKALGLRPASSAAGGAAAPSGLAPGGREPGEVAIP